MLTSRFQLFCRMLASFSFLLILASCTYSGLAQPQSGDVYREYRWTNTNGDAGGSLRVGGKVGYDGNPIKMPASFDLQHAIKAEVVIEKLLCHEDTRGLAISVNGNAWISVPECPGIPEPQWNYQHHIYPVVPLPLEHLQGSKVQFQLQVNDEHPWNWPQHLIYGVHFRIYYDSQQKNHPAGKLVSPAEDSAMGRTVTLRTEIDSPSSDIERVDFIGLYEGINLEGDGEYRQWHYHYVQAALAGHIGTVTKAPWKFAWDTSWIPDQTRPIELAARITDRRGITYQTVAVCGLSFKRPGLNVELCKPYDVPKKWVTRSGERTEKFPIHGDLDKAVAARMVWCSWSPGYMEGVYINDQKVFDREGPRYAYFAHDVPIEDLSVLHPGENTLKTGKTPKYDGKMVHGMEVNWPGIMVLIQYEQ